MITRLLITTKPGLLTVFALGIALVAVIAVSRDQASTIVGSIPSAPAARNVPRRQAIPTPEVPFVRELSIEQFLEQNARAEREKSRFLADCHDRGGRPCCGQGGCCGVPDTVLGTGLRTGMPFVFGELSTAVVERRLHARAAAIANCNTREWVEPGMFDSVSVELEIGTDGRVSRSSASGFDVRVASCVAGVLRAIRFSRPAHGTVEVRTSFDFHDANDFTGSLF